ncbi:MAG: hypothetical protein U5K70_01465 [Halodesulfurarchaeum sp.]|nr:hypothetical protein [Halodesulfurarchaeum sp.]
MLTSFGRFGITIPSPTPTRSIEPINTGKPPVWDRARKPSPEMAIPRLAARLIPSRSASIPPGIESTAATPNGTVNASWNWLPVMPYSFRISGWSVGMMYHAIAIEKNTAQARPRIAHRRVG